MEAIFNFISNVVNRVFSAVSKFFGSFFIFLGLTGFIIEFRDNRLTSISGVILIALFLLIGYKLVKNKEEKIIEDENDELLNTTLKKVAILSLAIPFLLYLLKHNIDEKEFADELLGNQKTLETQERIRE